MCVCTRSPRWLEVAIQEKGRKLTPRPTSLSDAPPLSPFPLPTTLHSSPLTSPSLNRPHFFGASQDAPLITLAFGGFPPRPPRSGCLVWRKPGGPATRNVKRSPPVKTDLLAEEIPGRMPSGFRAKSLPRTGDTPVTSDMSSPIIRASTPQPQDQRLRINSAANEPMFPQSRSPPPPLYGYLIWSSNHRQQLLHAGPADAALTPLLFHP